MKNLLKNKKVLYALIAVVAIAVFFYYMKKKNNPEFKFKEMFFKSNTPLAPEPENNRETINE